MTEPLDFEKMNFAVLGGGPFGLILSSLLAGGTGGPVRLWYPDPRDARRLSQDRMGQVLGSPYRLHENVDVIHEYDEFEDGPQALFAAMPSRQFEDTVEHLLDHLAPNCAHLFVILTKGLLSRASRRKFGSHLWTFSQFVRESARRKGLDTGQLRVAVVNGPSLLAEIYASNYTYFNVGCEDRDTAQALKDLLTNEFISVSTTTDILGTEIGGALKNPIAIACGMAEVMPGAASNLQGLLVSQGFKEMFRLGVALGAKPATLFGVSGLADIVTTATSPNSRNRGYGMQFMRQTLSHENDPGFFERIELFFRPTQFIEREVSESADLVEGAFALTPILELAEDHDVKIPLYTTIFDVLSRRKTPESLITLFGRPKIPTPDEDSTATKKIGLAHTAGHNFKKLTENRIFRHVSGSRGMIDRVHKQAPNIVKNLERRVEKARRKKNRRELEALPQELALWKAMDAADPDHIRETVEELIEFYVDEISDSYSPTVRTALIHTIGPLRTLVGGLRPGSAIPHVGGEIEELKSLAARYNILYAPTHRSHLDSVEVGYGLYGAGLPIPRYAAGSNLMTSPFWNWILKSLGAYAVDRERTRNILYLECLTRYATMMLEMGIPSLVYPEGTRSRTGGIVPIKTGLLSTAVEAYQHSGAEILIVPLAVSYENIPEDLEFAGVAKSTDVSAFVKHRTRVFMDVAEPVRVSQFINAEDPMTALGFQIQQGWAKKLRVLPNHIIARLLCEAETALPVADLPAMVDEFVQTHPGNYLTRDARKITSGGLKVLKKRKFVQVSGGKVEAKIPEVLEFYGNMAPASNF